MEKNHSERKKHLICGDFNIDMAESSSKTLYKNNLNNLIYENGMMQIMNEYTRITQNTRTLIDLVITNTNDIQCKVNERDNISDHSTIQIIWKNKSIETEHLEKKMILYKYNKQELIDELKQKDYSFCYDENLSCSMKAHKLIESLKEIVYKFKKEIEIKPINNNKWFDKKLKEMKQNRDETYKKANYTNDTQ